MKNIIEDKEQLFWVYVEHFNFPKSENRMLRREFNEIMLKKTAYQPYWWVCELIERGYDVDYKTVYDELI